jgi:hypothetical protein
MSDAVSALRTEAPELIRIDQDVVGARQPAAHVAVEVDHLGALHHRERIGQLAAKLCAHAARLPWEWW